MKIIPVLAAAAILVSTQVGAAAPEPPLSYGIDASQPYFKGPATVQVAGSCTLYKSYTEAWWGQVQDTNGTIGEGLIAKKGIEGSEYVLVGLVQSSFYLGGQNNPVSGKEIRSSFIDMSRTETAQALQALATNSSTCLMDLLQASPQAKAVFNKTPVPPAAFTQTFTLLYPFGGAGTPSSSTVGNLTTDTAKKFNGKIIFNGKRPAATVVPPVAHPHPHLS